MSRYQENMNRMMQKQIDELKKHAEVANEEMLVIKTDIGWIKDFLKKVDNRAWAILGTTILGFLTSIVLILIK